MLDITEQPHNADVPMTDPSTGVASSDETAEAGRSARKAPAKRAPRKTAKASGPSAASVPVTSDGPEASDLSAAASAPAKRAPRKAVARKATATKATASTAAASNATAANPEPTTETAAEATGDDAASSSRPSKPAKAGKAGGRTRGGKAGQTDSSPQASNDVGGESTEARADDAAPEPKKSVRKRTPRTAGAGQVSPTESGDTSREAGAAAAVLAAPIVLFQPPSEVPAPTATAGTRRRRATTKATPVEPEAIDQLELASETPADASATEDEGPEEDGTARRRRRRGRRGRGSRTEGGRSDDAAADASDDVSDTVATVDDEDTDDEDSIAEHADEVAEAALSASARRRRRRRRSGSSGDESDGTADDPPNTVVHVRDSRSGRGSAADEDGVRGVKGSTRLEAKRQRRRDNRDSGRRRAPILTEAEFLARRESVDRVMTVRQTGDRTQIAVLEDGILVEHYVTRASNASAVGNVYLGRVQNVLPSMEAAFIDIGRGRNGVLYAGEVNWEAAGLEGKARSIEGAMASGDSVLVQVTKDPIGHKGARLTSQISLPGRFVVYVPGGGMTGISRKLPDTERTRLKAILRKVVPDDAGVIVRTAAEGASEEDLISDVERLKTQWESISAKAAQPSAGPSLVYGEPDLAIRVVRDVFNDDFKQLVVAGSGIRDTIAGYVSDVAPDLADRITAHTAESDLFRDLRVDEQLAKALDRKVWLPSGGSLVIDRTEAMTVIDVNTGKYIGSGGNLEQTVTRNNLEAAEEIVRQLRLRDIGGIIVIDFIDMVLESNRDLVLRRLTECLGRDRTKHQVAEVTSLGLVQMTRKRVGEGLLEAFSEPCEVCKGRGVIVHGEPVDKKPGSAAAEEERPGGRGKRGSRKGRGDGGSEGSDRAGANGSAVLDPAAIALAEEQRRAAADAIAAIAKATAHTDASDTPAPATVVAADRVDRTDSQPADSQRADSQPAVSQPAVSQPAVSHPAVSQPAEATPRPRRRRAASRPAGPPVTSEAVGG